MGLITPTDGFLCTDGQFYPTREEALAHQHVLDIDDEIQAFTAASYNRFDAIVHIRQWEEHKKLKELKQ